VGCQALVKVSGTLLLLSLMLRGLSIYGQQFRWFERKVMRKIGGLIKIEMGIGE